MVREFALKLALIAFAASAACAALDGGDITTGLVAAAARAGLCFLVGLAAGEIARRLVLESAREEFAGWLKQITEAEAS